MPLLPLPLLPPVEPIPACSPFPDSSPAGHIHIFCESRRKCYYPPIFFSLKGECHNVKEVQCTLYLLACQVIVTVGRSGLCCGHPCYMCELYRVLFISFIYDLVWPGDKDLESACYGRAGHRFESIMVKIMFLCQSHAKYCPQMNSSTSQQQSVS